MGWQKLIVGTFGVCNLVLAAWGLLNLIDVVPRVIGEPQPDPNTPYFLSAFLVMSGINLLLVTFLAVCGILLLKRYQHAITMYSWFVLADFAYAFSIGFVFWPIGGPLGRSVAAATGIGNMGIAPFELTIPQIPFGYPFLSVIVLRIIQCSQPKVRVQRHEQ